MNRKASSYAVIGGIVGAVLTMVAGHVMPIGAQSGDNANFGKITCEELEVVSVIGRITISDAMINVKSELPSDIIRDSVLEGSSGATLISGGSIMISGDDGTALVDMRNDGHSGTVSVTRGGTGNLAAQMGATEDGGYVWVNDFEKDGGMAAMTIDENGGIVSVFGKGHSKINAAVGVDGYGNGAVNIWDANGDRVARLK